MQICILFSSQETAYTLIRQPTIHGIEDMPQAVNSTNQTQWKRTTTLRIDRLKLPPLWDVSSSTSTAMRTASVVILQASPMPWPPLPNFSTPPRKYSGKEALTSLV